VAAADVADVRVAAPPVVRQVRVRQEQRPALEAPRAQASAGAAAARRPRVSKRAAGNRIQEQA